MYNSFIEINKSISKSVKMVERSCYFYVFFSSIVIRPIKIEFRIYDAFMLDRVGISSVPVAFLMGTVRLRDYVSVDHLRVCSGMLACSLTIKSVVMVRQN